jgi:type II secretory pathway predicted ATPase ExeA
MFKRLYELRENPFQLHSDIRFLYVNDKVREALAAMAYGIQSRKGIVLLTGDVGTGKTTLLKALLDDLRRKQTCVGYIFNAWQSGPDFLELVLNEFGIEYPPGASRAQMIILLNRWLMERYTAGQPVVLIVDEAQNLSLEVLEEVRLLTNQEAADGKLLQVVLAGQPELVKTMAQPRLRPLAQRVAFWSRTLPLSFEQVREYVQRRLQVAGASNVNIFSDDALRQIHHYTHGVPRLVNLFCEHALIRGYVENTKVITPNIIEMVAHDVTMPILAVAPDLSRMAKATE